MRRTHEQKGGIPWLLVIIGTIIFFPIAVIWELTKNYK